MPINIPRSQISAAGAARRTLLPGSEAGLVFRSFGQLADSATKLSISLLGEQMKADQGVWETRAKANYDSAVMHRDQALLDLRNQEDLGPMDQEATLFQIYQDFVDDIEVGDQEATEGLLPRSQRILSRASKTRTDALREAPAPLLKAMSDSVDKSRLDLINARALNNYGDSPDAGAQAARDLGYAGDLLTRGVINAGELSTVQTTALNGMRSSYFSRGAEGLMDYALGAFASPGTGGISDLPKNMVENIRGDILQNPARYVGFTAQQISQAESGSFGIAPAPLIGFQYSSPDRFDLDKATMFVSALANAGFMEESQTILGSLSVGAKAQERTDRAGRDAAQVANALGTQNLGAVLGDATSRPSDIDQALSLMPPELLVANSESLISISNRFGALLPSFASALNDRMDEGDPAAWQTASDLMGDLGFIPVKALPDGFQFSPKRVQEIINYGDARANQGSVQAVTTAVGDPGRGAGRGTGASRGGDKEQAETTAVISGIVNDNPALGDMNQSGKDSITNLIWNNFLDNNLSTINADSTYDTYNDSQKLDLAARQSLTQYLTAYPPIERNGQVFHHRISLTENQRMDKDGNPADSDAWIFDELYKVMVSQTSFLEGVSEEEFFRDIAPYLDIHSMSEVPLGESSPKYNVSFFPKEGKFPDSLPGMIKNKAGTEFIFEPQYKDSFRASVGPLPKRDPLDVDTKEEVLDGLIGELVPEGSNYFRRGTTGAVAGEMAETGVGAAAYIGGIAWRETLGGISYLLDIVSHSVVGDMSLPEAFDAANARAAQRLRDIEAEEKREWKSREEVAGQNLLSSGQIPPALLRNPELVTRFETIVQNVARSVDPYEGAPATIVVDGEEVELRQWSHGMRSRFAAAGRGQLAGLLDTDSPEYQQYVYETSLEVLRLELAKELEDNPKKFLETYTGDMPTDRVSRLTPDAMSRLVERAVRSLKPPVVSVVVPEGQLHGPEEFPLKPLEYDAIATLIDHGPGGRSFGVPLGDPRVVDGNVEVWVNDNIEYGSLMPDAGGWVPSGWTTNVRLVQEVVSENPQEYITRISSALYDNMGEAEREAIFGPLGLIPGASDLSNKKPGWALKYYTKASQMFDAEWGTHPNEELIKMKITLSGLVPGDGASIMGLTNDQFFKILESGYEIHGKLPERELLVGLGEDIMSAIPDLLLEDVDDRRKWSYYRFAEASTRGDVKTARQALTEKIKQHRKTILEMVEANEKQMKSGKGGVPLHDLGDVNVMTEGLRVLEEALGKIKDFEKSRKQ